jgi:hypothetical protein
LTSVLVFLDFAFGEYDWSSTPAMGQALAAAVRGATFRAIE